MSAQPGIRDHDVRRWRGKRKLLVVLSRDRHRETERKRERSFEETMDGAFVLLPHKLTTKIAIVMFCEPLLPISTKSFVS